MPCTARSRKPTPSFTACWTGSAKRNSSALLAPRANSFGTKKLLIISLGDSETFAPERMQLVGEIVYSEASRLGVAHPFFAPTILGGGVGKFTTEQISE
jgi:hypothetical protein